MILLKSTYDEDRRESEVTVRHMGKNFYGYAYLHPDDEDMKSQYAGCRFAYIRAQISALKYELKIKKRESDDCINFVKTLEGCKGFEKDSYTAKTVYRQMNRKIRGVNKLIDEINDLQMELNAAIRQHDIIVKALKRKKKNLTESN